MGIKYSNLSRNMRRFILSSAFVLLLAAILFLIVGFINKNTFASAGVRIANLYLDDLSKSEAQQILEQKIEEYKNSAFFITTTAGDKFNISPKTIGLIFDVNTALETAYKYGKVGNFIEKILQQTRAFIFKKQIPLEVKFDESIMVHFVNDTLSSIHNPAKNASYIYNFDTQKFQFSSAREGQIININILQNKLLENAANLTNNNIELKQQKDEPLVYEDTGEQAKLFAQKIIESGPYIIETRQNNWEVEQEDLISWIIFKPILNTKTNKYELGAEISNIKVQDYLTPFAPGVNTEPINAEFKMENDRVVAFSLATLGYELDVEKSAAAIAESIQNLKTNIALEFIETEPAISQKSIQNLGIDSLLGVGESDFARSPNSRKHNIKVGSDKFQGILVAPNEEFSFNKNLGSVTAAEGYLPELVIKQGATVPEYGGGLCQVSTTLFRAAMYAGLEVTKRSNHSYPVIYYGTPGFDATIYPGVVDLKFKNDMSGHILIQSRIEGTKLIFDIYGPDNGRKVVLDGPFQHDQKTNGSMKAHFIRKTYQRELLVKEDRFDSNYGAPAPLERNPLE